MTRSQMRRQLYRGGGIASISRKNFGLGSKFQELKDKTVERVRKIIPNELADVATKAAPFVAMIPGGAPYAAAMRGLGRLDQRGDLTDALKQGALTYGFGEYVAPHIREGVGGLYEGAKSKIGAWGGPSEAATVAGKPNMFDVAGPVKGDQSFLNKVMFGKEGGTGKIFGDKGLIGAGGDFNLKGSIGKGIPAVFAGGTAASLIIQKALGDTGGRDPGKSLEAFNARRKGTVGQYLDFYFRRVNKFRIPPEEMDAAAAKFVQQNTQEYNQGGRVGLHDGGTGVEELEDRLQTDARPIIYEGDMRTRPMAKGGRIKYALGTGLPGIPGIPQMAEDGLEYDMSEHGGFQPLGSKEGKDEIKANLAKNEFVFTADAVRGAGDGDIELGAQKMYDTMKKLEGRVA